MKELSTDADWKAKCDREAESVKMNAKFYLGVCKMYTDTDKERSNENV
jgi:hypothetical protein